MVREDGREWMTVTPSERNTMLADIEAVSGKVAVFGLGLGYYAFMAANKPEVREVVVIERDPNVIALFTEHLLPQFPHREKITVLQRDAFAYASGMGMENFDWAYVDIWHDVRDGAAMYVRMKQLEACAPGTRFLYWIERSILAWLRSLILYEAQAGKGPLLELLGPIATVDELKQKISDDALRGLAPSIPLSAIEA